LAGVPVAPPGAQIPSVSFEYSRDFDGVVCNREGINPALDAVAQEQAAHLFPELNQRWSALGPGLLAKAVETVGAPFRRSELVVTLSLCPTFPSISHPLIVTLDRFVPKLARGRPLQPEMFVDFTFHEVLHLYLEQSGKLEAGTPLLRKYSAESPTVRAHLHLMALQQAVYRALGRLHLLEQDQAYAAQLRATANPQTADLPYPYRRAWEIVTREGAGPFIDELRARKTDPETPAPRASPRRRGQ
jgi:hypothetical protein